MLTLNTSNKIIPVVIIIIITSVIYANSFDCSFHFDDQCDIVDNPVIRNIWNPNIWTQSRPFVIFTFALNYHIHHYNVWGYHLVNLIIHIASSILVWWLVQLTLSTPIMHSNNISNQRHILGLLAALIFATHPMQTQAVTYIVQRMTSLAAMFYFLSLALYVKARLNGGRNFSKYFLFAASSIAALLAILSKQNTVTLPIAVVLYEWSFLKSTTWRFKIKDQKTIIAVVIFILFVILIFTQGFYTTVFLREIPPQHGIEQTITGSNYLLTQFRVIVTYIRLLLFPIHQNLDYDYPISMTLFDVSTLLSLCSLIALFLVGIFLFRKHRLIAFGIFWYLLALSVESSIIPLPNVIFEHRLYLPMFGFILVLIGVLHDLFWLKYSKMVIGALLLFIGINAILTYQRNKIWQNELTLWSDVVKKSPHKARPWNNRGMAYQKSGKYEEAIHDFSRALEIYPCYSNALTNRAGIYLIQKELNRAFDDLNNAINECSPKLAEAYYNRGLYHYMKKEYERSVSDFLMAIEKNPHYHKAYLNLGNAYSAQHAFQKAIQAFNSALDIQQQFPEAYNNRGACFLEIRNIRKALDDFDRAIQINPHYNDAYFNRGRAFLTLKQFTKATNDFSKAITLNPRYGLAWHNRAISYYLQERYNYALNDILKAQQLGTEIDSMLLQKIINAMNNLAYTMNPHDRTD